MPDEIKYQKVFIKKLSPQEVRVIAQRAVMITKSQLLKGKSLVIKIPGNTNKGEFIKAFKNEYLRTTNASNKQAVDLMGKVIEVIGRSNTNTIILPKSLTEAEPDPKKISADSETKDGVDEATQKEKKPNATEADSKPKPQTEKPQTDSNIESMSLEEELESTEFDPILQIPQDTPRDVAQKMVAEHDAQARRLVTKAAKEDSYFPLAKMQTLEEFEQSYEETGISETPPAIDKYYPQPRTISIPEGPLEPPPREPTSEPVSRGLGNMASNVTRGLKKNLSHATSTATRRLKSAARKAVASALSSLAASIAPLVLKGLLIAGGIILAIGAMISAIIALIGAIFVWLLAFVAFVVFILFIINSGAYIVPEGENLTTGGSSDWGTYTGPLPEGGTVTTCGPASGNDITSQLASEILRGQMRLLPDSNAARATGLCIVPTMIVMHWSAGYDNDAGNDATYSTLSTRDLACQMATDTNDTYLMQRFFDFEVELPYCCGEWNIYSINNEMAGGCTDSGDYVCNRGYSACEPDYPLQFDGDPPHPCDSEVDLTIDAMCKVMNQYGIGPTQIFGHYQVPFNGGKIDPGEDFLEDFFIPEMIRRCDFGSSASSISQTSDLASVLSASTASCEGSIAEIDNATRNEMLNMTWFPGCPVPIENLRIINVKFWNFNNELSGGQIIVHQEHAEQILQVFNNLCNSRFPIENVSPMYEYNGDNIASMEANNTSGFNCQNVSNESDTWTEQSYGRSVVINPVQNPYVSGSYVLPSSGSSFLDRTNVRAGMIVDNDIVTTSFQNIGWSWGGNWVTPINYMYFSAYNN